MRTMAMNKRLHVCGEGMRKNGQFMLTPDRDIL